MKTVILGVDENNRPIWNATFKDLTATVGFVPRVCRARRPQTKGKGESAIGLVKDNFLPGRRFTNKSDLIGLPMPQEGFEASPVDWWKPSKEMMKRAREYGVDKEIKKKIEETKRKIKPTSENCTVEEKKDKHERNESLR